MNAAFPPPATPPVRNAARRLRTALAALATLVLGGCSAIDFYWQGVSGQMNLIARARPIRDVLETTDDPLLKTRLLQVQAIRAFAVRELGLPDNQSYTRYSDLGRPYVVWNVVATPELSLTPRQWCYAIVGCVSYRGYFNEDQARAEAQRLVSGGDDVNLGGVAAYSTLGWFDDPVLSTFVRYRETELARLLFHELAHQIVYVKDDTAFNESFAVAVEEEGMQRWLKAQASRPDAAQLAEDAARTRRLKSDFRAIVRSTRDRLRELYASKIPEAQKRAGKVVAFAEMREQYERAKAGWGGIAAYDRWFQTGANNAGIAGVGLYADHVPEFAVLIAAHQHDMPRFYDEVKALAKLPKPARETRLAALARPAAIAGSNSLGSRLLAPEPGAPSTGP
ncbi:MAG: aminopeptidase [Pseudomonadota bacterium]|nr:aminopeptidase [Pseudomonadota bacterium]